MNGEYTVVPATELTWKLIDRLQLHSTVDSLRRSGSVSPCIEFVQGTERIPNLYYIKDQITESEWSVHALSSDVLKFLLGNSLPGGSKGFKSDPLKDYSQIITEPKCNADSSKGSQSLLIRDSGLVGKSVIEVRSGASLTFSGELKWIERDESRGITDPGYWIGVQLLSDKISKYPAAVIRANGSNHSILDLRNKYSSLGNGVFLFFSVSTPGQIFPIQIDWTESDIETLSVAVTLEINLDSNEKNL